MPVPRSAFFLLPHRNQGYSQVVPLVFSLLSPELVLDTVCLWNCDLEKRSNNNKDIPKSRLWHFTSITSGLDTKVYFLSLSLFSEEEHIWAVSDQQSDIKSIFVPQYVFSSVWISCCNIKNPNKALIQPRMLLIKRDPTLTLISRVIGTY